MDTKIHDFIIKSLAQCRGYWPQVADQTGVSIRTIQKIATKKIPNPGIKTCEILSAYFAEKPVFETKKRR